MDRQSLIHRQVLGILGIVLPFACLFFGYIDPNTVGLWYGSMSSTYHTNAITAFVGVLIATGIFMITYSGYDWRDKLVNKTAGIMALCIAIFPNSQGGLRANEFIGLFSLPGNVSNSIHMITAIIFFILLAVNILWLFTKGSLKGNKRIRNIVYLICGWGIIVAIAITGIGIAIQLNDMIVWIMEAIMLILFGTAWLVKGQCIKLLNDEN